MRMINTLFYKRKEKSLLMRVGVKQKLILRLGEKYKKYGRDVKIILLKLQHRQVVVDLDKKVLKRIVKKERVVRRMWKLNENRSRVRFENRKKRTNKHRRP